MEVQWESFKPCGKRVRTVVFVGTYEHSLDDKGRIVLPSSFRGRLADGGFLSKYDQCLALWTAEEFKGFVDRLMERMQRGEVNVNVVRSVSANAIEVKPDAQGRISIPKTLRDFAGVGSNALLTGVVNHIEIWAPERWQEATAEGDGALASLGMI